jgi:hypothetical protein
MRVARNDLEVHVRGFLLPIVVAITMISTSAAAQQSQTSPCTAPEFRQMDFWLGVWDAYYSADATEPGGRNTVTRAFDGCVIQEDFDGGAQASGLVGRSVSTYHTQTQLWRQTWVDNQGGYFALTGGPAGEDFILSTTRIRENAPHQRMVFEDITPDSFTWRWQSSADGGVSWTDRWVIWYRRAHRATE